MEIEIDKVLHRSLKDMGRGFPRKEADCIEIEYKLNSYGYRCNEFNDQEVLILGCSHTEGHGLPIESTWPHILSKKMNKDYINLAKGGDGAQAQVTKAFKFFEEFYNPKYIFAVFPITRLEVPILDTDSKNFNGRIVERAMFSNKKIKKYSKSPHNPENILTEDFAIFYNTIFIKMLIQYCKSNNIKFIWSNYKDMHINFTSFEGLDGYFESAYLKDIIKEECHLEFSENQFFNYAADYDYWPPGHWGLHQHLHVAESMYDMI